MQDLLVSALFKVGASYPTWRVREQWWLTKLGSECREGGGVGEDKAVTQINMPTPPHNPSDFLWMQDSPPLCVSVCVLLSPTLGQTDTQTWPFVHDKEQSRGGRINIFFSSFFIELLLWDIIGWVLHTTAQRVTPINVLNTTKYYGNKIIRAQDGVSAHTDTTTDFYWVISDDWEGVFLKKNKLGISCIVYLSNKPDTAC